MNLAGFGLQPERCGTSHTNVLYASDFLKIKRALSVTRLAISMAQNGRIRSLNSVGSVTFIWRPRVCTIALLKLLDWELSFHWWSCIYVLVAFLYFRFFINTSTEGMCVCSSLSNLPLFLAIVVESVWVLCNWCVFAHTIDFTLSISIKSCLVECIFAHSLIFTMKINEPRHQSRTL